MTSGHDLFVQNTDRACRRAGIVLTRFDPSQPRNPGTGEWVVMYHGTTKKQAEHIRQHGMHTTEGHTFPAKWLVTTANKQTADAYASGMGDEHATVEIHVPRDKLREHFWPAQDHIGGKAYAIKKAIPAAWVKKVHPVTQFVDYPA